MKTKILVLDPFTNGHEAALRFIRKMGWRRRDCEIVFCGSHLALLKRLTEGPAHAVIPTKNSIAGNVKEVLEELRRLCDMGYRIDVVDELDLEPDHCLVAPRHVARPKQLERVFSHEKALTQCGKHLDGIGIALNKRMSADSTGGAAKHVSRLALGDMSGAVASKAAARAYGLKILAQGIQDQKKNVTTFLLVQNEAAVKPVTVGIIGRDGRFGRAFGDFFRGLGCEVIGSDVRDPCGMTNVDVVKRADVVLFSIPVRKTKSVIRSVLPYSRPGQLFMDVTSVKESAIAAMLEGEAQVVGLHPMFAPEVPFDGQTIVACPARLDIPQWKTWVVNMLAATGAKVKWSCGRTHDIQMSTVQGSPHFANFASAVLLQEMGVSPRESLEYSSPFYRVTFSLMGRLLSQDPNLYAGILMDNPRTVSMLEHRIKIERRLLDIIRRKDVKEFTRMFQDAKRHFGEDIGREANELFVRLIAVTKTLYGKNVAVLEFSKADNRPGLLERVTRAFRRCSVNLTGINSVELDAARIQFTVSFDQPRSSDAVRKVLEEVEGWRDPKVRVVS